MIWLILPTAFSTASFKSPCYLPSLAAEQKTYIQQQDVVVIILYFRAPQLIAFSHSCLPFFESVNRNERLSLERDHF
ncbi:hypothetical protein DTO013E5_8667 [Penicillium roqueforti]|uniref:uncharacterized protein n=1 Tax=Penicillium roqueforti TaxID=5082 RepID=UPI00190BDE5F|nr:uncharacterized protein LCP9604111_3958 [Penicillium roqueforti]KAF9249858.1 hypothetical protein LCP9604111_3958 [Penicillium roqueforti]KAI1830481.1 hypothetical protein CBS147337_8755 [Penicillium roqueforti]KAI2673697.1 hypothetical protein CBS147355_7456 [Penicillium roqueforti]KAI2684920.1 hypothetical protein LCP963914a_5012 [Penicillium roqueforti]KAI2697152.1 hypothetical protein CBS147372_7890 [Penicillium roqueforti]